MHIDIYPTHNQIPEGQLIGKNVVIIDVLRATSVIATALNNGANKVKTTSSIEDALKQKEMFPALLLGGERDANKIEGFDFGNSPLEYTTGKVQNKTILLSTHLMQEVEAICDRVIMVNKGAIIGNESANICSSSLISIFDGFTPSVREFKNAGARIIFTLLSMINIAMPERRPIIKLRMRGWRKFGIEAIIGRLVFGETIAP